MFATIWKNKSNSWDKYNEQYNNLELIFTDDFHDRYFILDKEIVYHCGTIINKIGNKKFMYLRTNVWYN